MDVLEDYQDGLRRRHLLKLDQQRRQRGVLLLLRAYDRERIANVGRQRQQIAQERNAMLRWRTVFREPDFELGPLCGGGVASLKPRCALQFPDKGRQRAVDVMRRAKVVQRRVKIPACSSASSANAICDFPMPGSPVSNTARPSPFLANRQRRISSSICSSRPMAKARAPDAPPQNGFPFGANRIGCQTRIGSGQPLMVTAPRSRYSK